MTKIKGHVAKQTLTLSQNKSSGRKTHHSTKVVRAKDQTSRLKKEVSFMFDKIIDFDTKLFRFLNKSIKCKTLDFLMPIFTHIAGFSVTVGLCLFLMIFIPTIPGKTIIASVFFAQASAQSIKLVVKRLRPHIKLPDVNIFAKLMHYDPSFPSAHTATIVSLSTAIVAKVPWLSLPCSVLCLCVAISRIYLGQHYPFDVVIGAILGLIAGTLACIIF